MNNLNFILPKENEIDWLKLEKGLKSYTSIMKEIDLARKDNLDLAVNDDFKRLYVYFFKVRRSRTSFLPFYFKLLNDRKDDINISFINILEIIFDEFKQDHPSFSSKLIHSVNPNLPIWDSIVFQYFKISNNYTTNISKRKSNIINNYNLLSQYYNEILGSSEKDEIINIFNNRFKKYSEVITPIKKIDFMIWCNKKKKD